MIPSISGLVDFYDWFGNNEELVLEKDKRNTFFNEGYLYFYQNLD